MQNHASNIKEDEKWKIAHHKEGDPNYVQQTFEEVVREPAVFHHFLKAIKYDGMHQGCE